MPKDNLVPLLVKIGLHYNARAQRMEHAFPNFNLLPPVVRDNMDWSVFLDARGIGWHYDKVCGHSNTDTYKASKVDPSEGPQWLAVTCVPERFADAALDAFPDAVFELEGEDFAKFYDERAHCKEREFIVDQDVVDEIKALQELADRELDPVVRAKVFKQDTASKARRARALDPDDPEPGIRRNRSRFWHLFKQDVGVTLADPEVRRIKQAERLLRRLEK